LVELVDLVEEQYLDAFFQVFYDHDRPGIPVDGSGGTAQLDVLDEEIVTA
jgi:hypothetical protein